MERMKKSRLGPEKTPKESTQQVLTAGLAGLAVYLAVRGLGDYFEEKGVGEEEDDEDTEISADTHDASGKRFATGRAASSGIRMPGLRPRGRASAALAGRRP